MKFIPKKMLGYFLALSLLTSCASGYNVIRPEMLNYNGKSESNGVVLQYRYDVLSDHNNKKYAKKEKQNNTQLVAVKVTNNSDRVVSLKDDISLFAGESKISPLPSTVVQSALKQGVPVYLLYLLFTPLNLTTTTTTSNGQQSSGTFPVGYILGPGITAFNMIKAGIANQSLLKNLQEYSLLDKQLQPGESTYALIGINNTGFSPILINAGADGEQAKQ